MKQPPELTPLRRVLNQMVPAGAGYSASVPADWMQGRATYGGLSTALCLAAAIQAHDDLPPLRSAQLTFIGPAAGKVEIHPTLLRRGKTAAFVSADMTSGDRLAVHAIFSFGGARASALPSVSVPAPNVPDPDSCKPYMGKEGPIFAAHFNTRLATGAWPVTGASEADMCVWVQPRDLGGVSPVLALVTLADALPPAAIALFPEPAPLSSMTWTFDVLQDAPTTEDDWWLLRSTAQSVEGGYSAQTMMLWNTQGEPIIVGRQNVAVFC